jgi:RNA polymerase sigma-B factor
LIVAHVRLVKFLAHKFTGRGEPFEDLCQVGMIGLLKALERFDLQQGAQFSTYATPTITGEIRRYLRDHGSALKMSRALYELKSAVGRAEREYTAMTGKLPTTGDIAARLRVSEERILEAQEITSSQQTLSLETRREDVQDSLADRLGVWEEGLRNVDDQLTVKVALGTLSQQERLIILSRYYANRSQVDISRRTGVSQMQVSRLERAALKKMRLCLDTALHAS